MTLQNLTTMLNKEYWENRYLNDQAPWDAGSITTPIKEYIDSLADKSLKILVPGAGNAHEFEYLYTSGFTNSFVLDFAPSPLENLKQRMPALADDHVIFDDFFAISGQYDLIIEQTFFCALDRGLRQQYARKMYELLKPGGTLAGLLFEFPLTEQGPPFGGSREEYEKTFSPYFDIIVMEPARNSIKPREGRELFIIFRKKQHNP